MKVGESVQIRPSNLSGVVQYLGRTEFAPGTWVGVELDTSQGKNDGSVKGKIHVHYFSSFKKRHTKNNFFLFILIIEIIEIEFMCLGIRYFSCQPKKGVFVKPKNLKLDKVLF